MKKLICILLCLCFLFGLVACSPEKPDYTALSEKAQTIADTIVSDYGSTSVQYAIIDGGKIIISGGGGVYDKEENRAITKDDMFGIGSTGKIFVTAAAMTLVDEGLLDIDKPLTAYIPEFKMADERYKQITPRMLMNHSSGLYGSSFSDSFLFNEPCTEAHDTLLLRLASQRLKVTPGEICEYCNDGFSLLEILVERLSGMSYTEFLAENFCKPLGLTHTKTPQDDFDREQLVKVYLPLYGGTLPNDTLNVLGTGGVYSTAEDLCCFAEVLMGNKPEILSANSALLMRNEEYKKGIWPDDNGEGIFGFGLGYDTVHAFPFGDYGIKAAVKSGDSYMFHSSLVTIPEYDIAMAVVAAGGNSVYYSTFAAVILQELLLQKGIIKEISPERTFEAPMAADMPEEYTEYSGLYATDKAHKSVTVQDGMLTISSPNGKFEYVYAGDGDFISGDGSERVRFLQLSDGRTFLQESAYLMLPGLGQFAVCSFTGQKTEPAGLSKDVLDSWNARAGMKYYLVSEKPTSQAYFMDSTISCMKLSDNFDNGYALGGTKITDEDLAVNTVIFRDVTDLVFFRMNGDEYLNANDLTYISEDAIPELTVTTECAIDTDGYAKYYSIGADVAGKTIAVTMPKGAAYAVYDENDICVDFSTVSHNTTTVLPANGKIALIGTAGDGFEIALQ